MSKRDSSSVSVGNIGSCKALFKQTPINVCKEGALRFSVLRFGYFFDRVFGFCVKRCRFQFRFWCSMRLADFSFFSIWFSVFVKNTQRFFGFGTQCVFWFLPIFFPVWTYLGIQFSMRFSVLADFACRFAVLDEVFFGFAVSSIPQCPPP